MGDKKKLPRRLGALALCVCLTALPVRAAAWPDLPAEHWAFAAMDRAQTLGLVGGLPDGTIRPEGTLSWGEFLTMLARAFFQGRYAPDAAAPGIHWAFPAYQAALDSGVLYGGDFLSVNAATLGAPLTRRDAAVLAVRTLEGEPAAWERPPAVDFDALPPAYQPAVARAYALELMTGYPDGSFGGEATLTRAQGATLLLRMVDLYPASVEAFAPQALPEPEDPLPEPAPETPFEDPEGEGGAQEAPAPAEDPALRELGENEAKHLRLFGAADKRRFSSREEAQAHMTSVTVPVWSLDRATGEKTPSQLTFTVHEALAADMEAIFTEIFYDLEQFPIKDVGSFRWQDGARGEHNCGTAIDLNWNENYQVYAGGQVGAGSHWLPGEDPWSIPADGSVVRIFKAHGYSWGGDAWPTNRDYMHFSYMGV